MLQQEREALKASLHARRLDIRYAYTRGASLYQLLTWRSANAALAKEDRLELLATFASAIF